MRHIDLADIGNCPGKRPGGGGGGGKSPALSVLHVPSLLRAAFLKFGRLGLEKPGALDWAGLDHNLLPWLLQERLRAFRRFRTRMTSRWDRRCER